MKTILNIALVQTELYWEEKFNNLQKELQLVEKCYVKVEGSDDKQIDKLFYREENKREVRLMNKLFS